jgi:hypothetical protein
MRNSQFSLQFLPWVSADSGNGAKVRCVLRPSYVQYLVMHSFPCAQRRLLFRRSGLAAGDRHPRAQRPRGGGAIDSPSLPVDTNECGGSGMQLSGSG